LPRQAEGIYTTQWLHHPDRRYLSRGTYRAAELLVIAIFLRLLTWFLSGGLPGPAVLRSYLLSPLSSSTASMQAIYSSP
jgi:hypothetical protein